MSKIFEKVIEKSAATITERITNAALREVTELFKRSLLVTMEVRDYDIYSWLDEWMAAHEYGKGCSNLKVKLVNLDKLAGEDADDDNVVSHTTYDNSSQRIVFTPGLGNHIFRYKGTWIWVQRQIEGKDPDETYPEEFFQIQTLGKNTQILKDLINEAYQFYYRKRIGKITVRRSDGYGGWQQTGLQDARSLDSVILHGDIAQDLIRDIKTFIDRESWYKDKGIPWRRGYLFHGPPGNGKTSLTKALASHFMTNLYVMSFAGSGGNDDRLVSLFNDVKDRSIILIEDIDALFSGKESKVAGISFSGLLNAIDGIESGNGRILIMTTNYPDALASSLIRPGRVDLHQFIGPPDEDQVRRMFKKFYPDAETRITDSFMKDLPIEDISMAALQSYFVKYIDEPEVASQNKDEIYKYVNGDDDKKDEDGDEDGESG